MLVYVDSSVIGRAYLADEPGHREARELLSGDHRLVTGTLTHIEVTGLLARAARAGRLNDELDAALATLADDLGDGGVLTVVRPADQPALESAARRLTRTYALRALDALHLAVAQDVLAPLADADEVLAFASRGGQQAAAAEALGFTVI